MRLEDFHFELPPDRIAQLPLEQRDASRLMSVDGASGRLAHRRFVDLPDLLSPGDLLVINDTRVRPARLHGRRAAPGTGGRVEALLVERLEGEAERQVWSALVKGSSGEGDRLAFGASLRACVTGRQDELYVLEIECTGELPLEQELDAAGAMPLPPYIRREAGDARDALDRQRYQTIFAREGGAVAAPTASLHFTDAVLDRVLDRGVSVESLTLHVGPGTFQPVRAARVEDHHLLAERFVLPERLAAAVARARHAGGRVVAAGTTVTRTLESRATGDGEVEPGAGACDLFIVPGHGFRVVDALLTNFHLPRSTLLMLVCAFAGRGTVLDAYKAAVEDGYRFYSYGDAMFLTPAPEARR